ncbi:S8 family serine peptidase [Bacillus sp. 165]|uniref:S8 family serine peptidase n=1 Tax=Bacillus sp. 165 TaxID=1529117 RepID=UPI001ADAB352|nr:S8 family serine peptidase [Bacillus sp. 165]MBO9131004.1 S8 family serine peptidase [Bacillus sp. 165]
MRKKASHQRMGKSLAVFALSSSFVFASLGQVAPVSTVKAVSMPKAEELLANLSTEQRDALKQLAMNETTGLHISSDIDQSSSDVTSVIVEFVNKPAKVAQLVAAEKGLQLSDDKAKKLVEQDHANFKNEVGQVLTTNTNEKADYKILRSYKHAFNGVSMSLPANQIKHLLNSKTVKAVWSNESVSVEPPVADDAQLKADEAKVGNYTPYDGLDRLHSEGFTGKGIKVGILDTGMDYHHPDLKDAYKGGYDFVDDDNDPMETTYADWVKAGKPGKANGADYYTEHGTHVAGIIGGRGTAKSEYKILGAAPEADLYAYRVLGPGGRGSSEDIIAAVDRAVEDGMDVINMSLGATINNPLYPTSIAVNNAVLNGVTAVVSAGNSGNQMFTLGSPGTAGLALTVGASSISLDIYQYSGVNNNKDYTLRQLARNYTDDLTTLKGQTVELVNVGLGNTTDFVGKNVKGKVAFIQRGSIGLIDKIKNAKANGAIGVIMANNAENQHEGAIQSFIGEAVDAVASFSVSYDEGMAISEAIKAGQNQFTFGDFSKITTGGDELAGFSSRGPSRVSYEIKPEVVAPGVSIMSSVPFYVNDQSVAGTDEKDYLYAYQRMSGTSMAAPYVAGVSALLLQSNKDLQPEDIKAILMNTADPLSKKYSVYEVGSGRVDAYEAIHSNVQLEVKESTKTLVNGEERAITESTGAMNFGSYAFDGKDIIDVRQVKLTNRSEKAKTFDVDVTFQEGLRGSKDAKANNVALKGPSFVQLNKNGQQAVNFQLSIPKTAENGTYEGYVTFTNQDDPTEQYQIPFGGRVVTEGIESFRVENPLFSTRTTKPSVQYAYPYQDAAFTLKTYMKYIDVVLHDPTTGEDIGYIGYIPSYLVNEGVEFHLAQAFSGMYYPFTGDKNKPVSSIPTVVKPGHYQLKLVTTSESGHTFTKTQDIVHDIAPPIVTSSFDSLDQKVIEYDASQLDSKGQFLYDFNINVHDPEVEEAKSYGIPVDQSHNSVVSFYNSPFGSFPMPTNQNGDYTDKILVDSKIKFLPVSFYGRDAAANGTIPISVIFAKNTDPYYYLKASTDKFKTGESINYTVRSNNIKNLKTTKLTMNAYNDHGIIENVKVNDAVKQYGDATVTVTTAPSSSNQTTYTMTFTYNGTAPLPEDLSLFTFDVKAISKTGWGSLPVGSYSTTTVDQNNVETKNVYTFMERNFEYQLAYSNLISSLKLEGTINPATNTLNSTIDQRNINAKITATSRDGKTTVEGAITSKTGAYTIAGLPVDRDDYNVTVDVPGHFTTTTKVDVTDNIRGELYGKVYTYNLFPTAAAGDTNKDNVIDILDAIAVQAAWGKKDQTATDFNFDGVVDAKDFNYIVKNFGLQNQTVANPPKAITKYKAKTLADIQKELGIQ